MPSAGGRHRVAFFNPGSNASQVSRLRLVHPGEEAAEVSVVGVDDRGESPGGEVTTTIPAGASRTFTAAALESGGEGFEGALGDGAGKWRLVVQSAQPIVAMSLLSDRTGHLTNLSTAPGRESQGPPDLVVVSPSRIGGTTRQSTLLWEYRCGRCRVRCRCGNRQNAVEMPRFGAGNRERMSGRRWRPRGAGIEAQRGCGAPAGAVRPASGMGRPGVRLRTHAAAVRGGSRCRRCCARRDGRGFSR